MSALVLGSDWGLESATVSAPESGMGLARQSEMGWATVRGRLWWAPGLGTEWARQSEPGTVTGSGSGWVPEWARQSEPGSVPGSVVE